MRKKKNIINKSSVQSAHKWYIVMVKNTFTVSVRKVNEIIEISEVHLTADEPEPDTFSTGGAARVPTGVDKPETYTYNMINQYIHVTTQMRF